MVKAAASETDRHRLAFEEYYSQGARRTYDQVADKLGVSASTIKLWSRTYGWKTRIAERDADATRQLAQQTAAASLEDRDRDLKIVRMAKMKLTRDIAEGRVKGKFPDLDMLLRMETELLGTIEDRLSWIERETDPDRLKARLREIAIAAEIIPENTEETTDG